MAKTKSDKKLYERLRSSGVRKKVAKQVAEALPKKGSAKKSPARRIAADLSEAAEGIKDRVKGGPAKRSAAAKKAARTRKTKAAKRSAAAKKRRQGAREAALVVALHTCSAAVESPAALNESRGERSGLDEKQHSFEQRLAPRGRV